MRIGEPQVAMSDEICVLVLGDVGRSPRMQYHALSLANMSEGTRVTLVGYEGENCFSSVREHPRVRTQLFKPFAARLPRKLFLLLAPIKVAIQLLQLLWILLVCIPRPAVLLLQNPPSIPTLMVAWLVGKLRGSRVAIDWHNLGYTVLGTGPLGHDHWLVKVALAYERAFAVADAHFCVTVAMRGFLDTWGVTATTLYDKPPAFFRRTTDAERHELCARLAAELEPAAARLGIDTGGGRTLFTEPGIAGSAPTLRADRPALVVSSTSWTEDEDFGMLLAAIEKLDAASAAAAGAAAGAAALPKLLFVVTGKGPQKAMYEARMRQMDLRRAHVCTMWLEPGDYPLLLGTADLGVCLHTSTSGLDLPMKVLDFFGAGLPVCAVGFSCLDELVQHGKNGMVFQDSAQLAEQMQELLGGFPHNCAALHKLRDGVANFERWVENWDRCAKPHFERLLDEGYRSRLNAVTVALCAVLAVAFELVARALTRFVENRA